ncbi:hypothetical protein B0H16DRAFT_1719376 [Mycena metata]|uniref:Uncharacterized protein n=1 Tax=Mycena metata TaxID=1033252 RepID=A0AAD7JEF1_9AGAR|nr:hypothetical protein B0H16DRAFT_1719376 [Mycena metata]
MPLYTLNVTGPLPTRRPYARRSICLRRPSARCPSRTTPTCHPPSPPWRAPGFRLSSRLAPRACPALRPVHTRTRPRASYASSAFPPSSTPIIRGRLVLQSHCAAAACASAPIAVPLDMHAPAPSKSTAVLPTLHETTLRSAHPPGRLHGRRAYTAVGATSIHDRTTARIRMDVAPASACTISRSSGRRVRGLAPCYRAALSSLAMVPSPPMTAMTLAFPFDATGRAPCVGLSIKNLGGRAGLVIKPFVRAPARRFEETLGTWVDDLFLSSPRPIRSIILSSGSPCLLAARFVLYRAYISPPHLPRLGLRASKPTCMYPYARAYIPLPIRLVVRIYDWVRVIPSTFRLTSSHPISFGRGGRTSPIHHRPARVRVGLHVGPGCCIALNSGSSTYQYLRISRVPTSASNAQLLAAIAISIVVTIPIHTIRGS